MGLHELELRNFRAFNEFLFEPDRDAITVLLSPNGTGKTTILEAVYALATASSFRTNAASDLIRSGESMAEVHGVLFHQERRVRVDLVVTRGVRNTTKRMLVNGQRPRSRADLSDALPLTIFTPEGVDVVRQGPEHRRTFLTNLLTDVDLATGDVIERFNRILNQRNALIRSWQGERPSFAQRDELEVWTIDFAAVSDELVGYRQRTLRDLEPLVVHFYQQLAESDDEVSVAYEQSWSGSLIDALNSALANDCHRGHTTVGPQRDDVRVILDGRDTRRQASQGEQRSLALALRLAGHELVRRQPGRKVLVLSDRKAQLTDVRAGLEASGTGVTSGFYWGGMKRPALAESEGKQVMLATFSYAAEGMDVPGLDTLILASPKSDIEQSVGRILRQKAGDRAITPLVYDFVDAFSLFERQGAKRAAFYRKFKYRIFRDLDAALGTRDAAAVGDEEDDEEDDDNGGIPKPLEFLDDGEE